MKPFRYAFTVFWAVLAASLLAACSPSPQTAAPSQAAPAMPTVEIKAPAGQYKVDPNHASLTFRLNHLGLSNYVARFTRFDVTLDLDPANVSASKVTASVEPASVRTDYSGDYKAGHKESPFAGWDEDLAQSPKFFNASQFPQATFRSTSVESSGPGRFRINGELSLLGQTHPLTLDATVVGSVAAHPFTQRGALGFTATGTFNRSGFGMTHLLQPLLVGDAVTVEFNGEFHQAAPAG